MATKSKPAGKLTPQQTDATAPQTSDSTHKDTAGVAADILDEQPQPSQHAIEQAQAEAAKQNQIRDQFAGYRDLHGRPFDPELHVTGADGKPELTRDKTLRLKRGVKKGTVRGPYKSTVAKPGGTPGQPTPQMTAQAHASGKSAANLLITVGVAFGGEEWNPRTDPHTGLNEQAMLEKAFADYFIATGRTDIPPGWALVIACGSYTLPRFTQPKTQTRVKKGWGKLKGMFKKKDKINGTQPDIGHDGERQDDTGETTRPTLQS